MLCFRKFLIAKKFMDKKGGVQNFPWKIFCLTVPKNFVDEPFRVSLDWGNEKFHASEGYVTIFRRKFFVSQYRNNISLRNPSVLCFGKFPVANKFMDKKGGSIKIFRRKFCLTVPKDFVGEPFFVSQNFR